MDDVAGLPEGRAQRAERWSFIGKLRVAEFPQFSKDLQALVEVLLSLGKVFLGSSLEGLVNELRRNLALLDELGPLPIFLVAL